MEGDYWRANEILDVAEAFDGKAGVIWEQAEMFLDVAEEIKEVAEEIKGLAEGNYDRSEGV